MTFDVVFFYFCFGSSTNKDKKNVNETRRPKAKYSAMAQEEEIFIISLAIINVCLLTKRHGTAGQGAQGIGRLME